MKPKQRKIAKKQRTRKSVAYLTKSTAMMKMPLSLRCMPPLQKSNGSSLQKQTLSRPFEALENILGRRISHGWKEANEPVIQWKAIILDQLPTNPSLYLLKYDGIDCVYGLELHSDERILNLKFLPNNIPFPQETDTHLSNTIVSRAVKHTFEGTNGSNDDWKGMVVEEVPIMKTCFYITYKKDPVLYLYHHLDEYIESNLHIMPGCPPIGVNLELGRDSLAGKSMQNNAKDGTQKIGKIIYQVPTKPSVHFIKFYNDFNIYVYDLMKMC
ncbi:Y-linked testis-specific protein 1-like [Chionomys nivalis]|uniref:Y-linked testis-specific protein 1-like n=1 Tax=Chionomys nivalis TaxID=269649 RepID=UPI002597144D|nr:Y-linked testis-specific protein 1-like [Chionomys nivalis]